MVFFNMGKSFFDKCLIENRIILQSSDKNSKVNFEEGKSVCEDCEMILGCPVESFSEEFVWHPDKNY